MTGTRTARMPCPLQGGDGQAGGEGPATWTSLSAEAMVGSGPPHWLGQRDTSQPGATAGASTPPGPCLHPGPICPSPCDNREVAKWGASLDLGLAYWPGRPSMVSTLHLLRLWWMGFPSRAVTELQEQLFPLNTPTQRRQGWRPWPGLAWPSPAAAPSLSLKRGGRTQKW